MEAHVTGGGGFIVSHLAARLLEQAHRVRVLDNFATGRRSNVLTLGGEVEVIEGDLRAIQHFHGENLQAHSLPLVTAYAG